MVGVGTRMSNGCTSGHSICGIPRLSKRSIVATGIFVAAGMAMATLRSNVSFFVGEFRFSSDGDATYLALMWLAVGILTIFAIVYLIVKRAHFMENFISFLVGGIFSLGLMVGGMLRITKILGFLTLGSGWDPQLVFVMIGAIGLNLLTFNFILKGSPRYDVANAGVPSNSQIDTKLIVGAVLFGLGWGLSGLCPGPGMVNLFWSYNAAIWCLGVVGGMLL